MLEAAHQSVCGASRIAVLTGAGVSAESGIPTFRSNGGFWQNRRFEDLATPQGFARDPKFVWQWYEERRRGIAAARPNAGHEALVAMEKRATEFTLITQNVDGLHDACGGMLRPGVVWFGEMLPEGAMERATAAVQRAEVLIVARTSAVVYPAAGLIPLAIEGGAAVIEINPEATDFSGEVRFSLRGKSTDILPRLT